MLMLILYSLIYGRINSPNFIDEEYDDSFEEMQPNSIFLLEKNKDQLSLMLFENLPLDSIITRKVRSK